MKTMLKSLLVNLTLTFFLILLVVTTGCNKEEEDSHPPTGFVYFCSCDIEKNEWERNSYKRKDQQMRVVCSLSFKQAARVAISVCVGNQDNNDSVCSCKCEKKKIGCTLAKSNKYVGVYDPYIYGEFCSGNQGDYGPCLTDTDCHQLAKAFSKEKWLELTDGVNYPRKKAVCLTGLECCSFGP